MLQALIGSIICGHGGHGGGHGGGHSTHSTGGSHGGPHLTRTEYHAAPHTPSGSGGLPISIGATNHPEGGKAPPAGESSGYKGSYLAGIENPNFFDRAIASIRKFTGADD